MAVDPLPQPGQDLPEPAAAHLSLPVRDVARHRRVELRAVQVAQRVGREITDGEHRPVDVLQHAVGVALRDDAEQRARLLAPGVGQVVHLQVAVDHAALQREAQQYVQVVGHLVGLHADVRRLHGVDRAIEPVQVHVGQGSEARLKLRVEVLPERAPAADQVLPEARLGLADAERGARAQGAGGERRRDAQPVQAVAALVNGAEHAGGEQIGMEAGGEPAVGGAERGGERMCRHVQAARVGGETERGQQVIAERALRAHVEVAPQHLIVDRDRRTGDPFQQVDQRAAQRAEHGGELGGAHPRFERVQQRIVAGVPESQVVGLLAGEAQRFLQIVPEHAEVGVLARGFPTRVVDAGLAGDRRHQFRRQPGLAVVGAPQLAQKRPVDLVEVGARLPGGDQLAHLGRRLALVDLPLQQRKLIRPLRDRPLRHVGLLVPLQQPDDVLHQVDLPIELAEAVQRWRAAVVHEPEVQLAGLSWRCLPARSGRSRSAGRLPVPWRPCGTPPRLRRCWTP